MIAALPGFELQRTRVIRPEEPAAAAGFDPKPAMLRARLSSASVITSPVAAMPEA